MQEKHKREQQGYGICYGQKVSTGKEETSISIGPFVISGMEKKRANGN